ncbi:hypothetical protein [Acetanaerobacterium elongatum]|uniref:Uncharacterized protein n=1 Tax=Acetanaerobacterium elongatum TaxID=258515 RepID=A0A1G9VR50_9FIRM|nr:hypothetical protein [Acetanaerobacterium elongatum]SDM74712.1 hypothetical protein SAMN05192585_10479 [Acetanaerobacterium elongatum]
MKFYLKTFVIIIILVALFLCLLGSCTLVESIAGTTVLGGQATLSSGSSNVPTSSAVSSSIMSLKDITLYPAVGALNEAQLKLLLGYATENHREIFNFQVAYISDSKATSTNIILPTGHTLYEDEKGRFIFSGGNVVYVKDTEETKNLEDPDNPLYNTELMRDVLELDGRQLYDENGVLISFEDISNFLPITGTAVDYNNVIINAGFAAEALNSTTLNLPLSFFGLKTLDDAKMIYSQAKESVMISGVSYVPVVHTDILSIYFDGNNGFLLDVHSLALPRKTSHTGIPETLDYYGFENASKSLYTGPLNEMGLNPVFEAKELIPNQKITVYDSFTGKLEEITPLLADENGALSLSLEAVHIMFGARLTMDDGTKTLHVLTDPYYSGLTEQLLGSELTDKPVRVIDENTAAAEYQTQQQKRLENGDYLPETVETASEPSLPKTIIRTPKRGQFTYPGSSTKIWKSGYAGKPEPTGLSPTMSGDWVWNSATGFWEGTSPLSGEKIVWHPSYGAAFTIR